MFKYVPMEGIEPPSLSAYGSKPYASANFATSAYTSYYTGAR